MRSYMPERIENSGQINTCTCMFIAALLTVAKDGNSMSTNG